MWAETIGVLGSTYLLMKICHDIKFVYLPANWTIFHTSLECTKCDTAMDEKGIVKNNGPTTKDKETNK